jgi:hypothetical protein
MLWFFNHKIAPETDLISNWNELSNDQQKWYCAALLREHFDAGYRTLVERLENSSRLASEAGFSSCNISHYSTFSRKIRDFNDEMIREATQRASNAAYHVMLPGGTHFSRIGTDPSKPRSYYELLNKDWEVSMDKKMSEATRVVAEYLALTTPHLRFDRDREASNFQYPITEFYRLFAHIALEDCYAANGAEILQWQSDDEVNVPSPSLIHKYASEREVEDHEERFFQATCALLEREGLSPSEPIHLAYDVTTSPWYGEDHKWTTGSLPENNTNQFWHYAVLSAIPPGQNDIDSSCRNYILSVTPVKNRSEISAALNRMLNRVRSNLELELDRIYLDRQMYESGVVTECRKHDLNWIIQAPNKGAAKELASNTPLSELTNERKGVEFSDFDYSHRQVNVFVSRVHEDEVGRDDLKFTPSTELTRYSDEDSGGSPSENGSESDRDRQLGEYGVDTPEIEETSSTNKDGLAVGNPNTHTAWITDLDVEERNLRGLAYQFRKRWKIETAIRQLKRDFLGRCGSSNRRVRTLYVGAAQLFFNFWVALNHELPYRLRDPPGFRLTAQETLHAIRDADVIL